MVFQPLSPEDRQAENQCEGHYVPQRDGNTDDRVLALVKRQEFETVHDDRGRDPQPNDSDAKRKSEPSDGSMPASLADLYQARLQDEEENPSIEDGSVQPHDVGRSNLRMKQPGGHGGAEHRRNQNEDEQRHAEIEVPVDYADEWCRVGTVDQTPRKRSGQ